MFRLVGVLLFIVAVSCSSAFVAESAGEEPLDNANDVREEADNIDGNNILEDVNEEEADTVPEAEAPVEQYEEEVIDMTDSRTISVRNFGIGSVIRLSYTAPRPTKSPSGFKLLKLISASGEILLHINPRYHAKGSYLVLNSYLKRVIKRRWGCEERPLGFPFNAASVTVVVTVTKEGYNITANGGAFSYLYAHRIDVRKVASIESAITDFQYGAVITGGNLGGRTFKVQGTVESACSSGKCGIYLFNGKPSSLAVSPLPSVASPNVSLVFNPNIEQDYVVRNTYTNGAWGKAEICGRLPFMLSVPVNITITETQTMYKIYVNGGLFAKYVYRLQPQNTVTVLVSAMLGNSASVQIV